MATKDRVAKIAKGLSVEDAARAYTKRARGLALGAGEDAKADESDATLEAMFLMAAVDGSVAEGEIAQLGATMQAMLDTRDIPDALDLDAVLVTMSRRLERDGWSARLAEAANHLRSDEARSYAFRLATAVAFVDDHVAHAEAAAIDALAAALHLSADASNQILHEVRESLFG